jgi:hypothetical protein
MLKDKRDELAFDSYIKNLENPAGKLEDWNRGLEIYRRDSNATEGLLTPDRLKNELTDVYDRRSAIVKLWEKGSLSEKKGRDQVDVIDRYCSALYALAMTSFRTSAILSSGNVELQIGEIALTVPRLPVAEMLAGESARAINRLMEQFKAFEKRHDDMQLCQAEEEARSIRKRLVERESERLKGSPHRFEHAALKAIEHREKRIQRALELLNERWAMTDRCNKVQVALGEWKRAESGVDASKKVSREEFDISVNKLTLVVKRLNYLGNPKPEDQKPGYNEGTWRETLKGQVVNLLSELERFGNSIGRIRMRGTSDQGRSAVNEQWEVLASQEAPPSYDACLDATFSPPRTLAEERRIALERRNGMLTEGTSKGIASARGG